MMNLKISVPTAVLFHDRVRKIVADGGHGSFCVLPRHTDYLAALVPGILILTDGDGAESYVANDHGLLVKQADRIFISVRRGLPGDNLQTMQQTVHDRFLSLDENDRACQTAVASLEANFLRKFLEMQKELS